MSGNQESGIRLPTWRRSDFNAAIPIKKRKYFVQPQLPAVEVAASALLEMNPQPSEQVGDTSVGRSGLDSSDADKKQKTVGGSRTSVGETPSSLPSVSVGDADKAEGIGNIISGQIRVKVEEPSFPVHSSPFTGFVGAELSGGVATSDKTGMKVEQSVLKTNDTENLRGERETETSPGANEEPTALDLSLSKGVHTPHNTDYVSTCTKSENHIGVNRSNWDLNTIMDDWEDGLEESNRQKTESAQVCPMGRVKQEVVGRINQEDSPSSGTLQLAKPVSIKVEPNSFSQSEVFHREDRTLSHFHTPVMQSDAILDLPTSSTSNQKDKCLLLSSVIRDSPMALNGMSINPDSTANENSGQSNSVANGKLCEVLKHDGIHTTSCSGRGDHNLNTSGVDVTSLTEEKILDDSKTCISKDHPHNYRVRNEEKTALSGEELEGVSDGLSQNVGRIVEDGELITDQIIRTSEGMSGVSTVSGGNVENPEHVNNSSPVSYKEEISTIDNYAPTEFSEGNQRRIINLAQVSNKSPIKTLDASGSFVPLRMERERLPDFPVESQRYLSRGSDESFKFSRERYHGKVMRSPRLNFMPDRRRFSDQTESNLHDRDTKNYEFYNHGNTRRGGGFMSNFRRGRRPENDEGPPFSHSFQRRTSNFSFTPRGPRNKEDTSAFSGFRDGEKSPRGSQCNNTESMYMSPQRPYRGRNSGFGRGRTNFSDNPKRSFPGFRSRSPVRSRERSTGPSSSFRNRSQEEFGGQTDFSHRRSPSGYRTERTSSPDHTSYQRERRHNSPPYSHRPSNSGRGRGYVRGRGYGRGRAYSWKPYDRVVHRNHENMNNLNPRERVNYSDDFFEGPIHSERFGVDVNVERRRFGYRSDGINSFRPSFYKDGCAPTNVENDPDAVRSEQDPHIEFDEQGSDMEIDGEEDNNSAENASGGTKNMDDEETSKQSKIWQQDELGGEGF